MFNSMDRWLVQSISYGVLDCGCAQKERTCGLNTSTRNLHTNSYLRDPNRKPGPLYPVTMASLCIHGSYNVDADLRVSIPCKNNEMIISHNDEITRFVALLRSCAKKKDISAGCRLHDAILKKGLLEKCSDALATMYARCGALSKAKELIEMHKSRDIFSWTALIAGYVHQGQGQNAMDCFERMQHEGLSPDAVTFACLLRASGSIGACDKGEKIHDEIARQGMLRKDIVLGTALVDMYAKCGALAKAQQVFEELPKRDIITWSALIAGYAQHGQGEESLNCFEQMQGEGLSPNAMIYSCVLKACGSIRAVNKGKQIHDKIVKQGLLRNDIVLGTALVDMYAKCGALAKSQQVLEELPSRNVITWSALITGYTQQGHGKQALKCFEQMQGEGFSPDAVTLSCILNACGSIGAADKGEQIHDEIARQGFLRNNLVVGNALVDMYAKCGALAKARQVLVELPSWDVVSWNALIAGYAQHGEDEEALNCFEQMQHEGLSPDGVTFTSILKACGSIKAADKGKQIYDEIARYGLMGDNIVLGNALVDMFAKCGALTKAQRVFEELPSQDVVSWNALVSGYVQQGQGEQALNCFRQMQSEGISPDIVTFSCMLIACSHLGLIDDGQTYFMNMSTEHGMKPDSEHYTCIVDIFGRTGHLDKAVEVIEKMPSPDYSTAWATLLGACQKWGDVNVGRWAFEHVARFDKSDASPYVLMANLYAAAGMPQDAEKIEMMRMENKACEEAWHSWSIDMSGNAHSFLAMDAKRAQR